MKKLALAWALACAPLPVLADEVDDFMREHLAGTQTPGAAVAVIRDGVPVRVQGFGFANLEHKVPVHPDTVFQSGSIGKMFTGMAVMLMVEDGKLDLDKPVRAYLPGLPESWAAITTRHLLTHTSGIGRTPGMDLRKDYTEDELLEIFSRADLNFPAGERYSYSNVAFAVAGILVRKVGGQWYGDVLRQRVFRPLGMTTAGVIDDRGIVPNRAAGYFVDADTGALVNHDWVSPTGNSTADGSLYLTLLDWVKWEAAVRRRAILKPESWTEIFRPVRLNSGKTYPYGFGWSLDEESAHATQGHGGTWQGFRTQYTRYLDQDTVVVALTNCRCGQPAEIARNVARLVDPRVAEPAGAPIEDRDPEVTRRVRGLLGAGELPEAERARFASERTRDGFATQYAEQRKPLGPLQELRLFRRLERGDDRLYRYRARFAGGVRDLGLTLAEDGRIHEIDLKPVAGWNAPLN